MPRNFLNTAHQNVAWFSDQDDLDRLNLRPPFQRRPVWLEHEKSFLIDSILRGYPVPEIYIFSSPNPSGMGDVIGIVDGQQRLRACLEYLADGFAVSFDVEKLLPLYTLAETPWFGKRYSELTTEEKDAFRKYKFIVRELEDVTEDEVRHMFHRLNQSNVTLNAQELRYSMYTGGMLQAVEEIAKYKQWDKLGIFTVAQRRRMIDSEFISELVIGTLHWPQNKKDNLDHYYRLYSGSFPFGNEIAEKFIEVLNDLVAIFPSNRMNGTRWYKKSDFYTLFLLISRGKLSIETEDETQIENLREALTRFGALVDSDSFNDDKGPIGQYRDAVTRAATDRARRIRREQALVSFLLELGSVIPGDGDEADPEPSQDEIDEAVDRYVIYLQEEPQDYEDEDSEYEDE